MTAWTILIEGTKETFLPSYIEIGPVVCDNIFKVFYIDIQDKINPAPTPLAAIFFDESWRLEQSWERVTEETFLLNYIEIRPAVSGKIFKVFYIDIYKENKSRPLAAIFFDETKWLERSW